jgi:hypothetical protein
VAAVVSAEVQQVKLICSANGHADFYIATCFVMPGFDLVRVNYRQGTKPADEIRHLDQPGMVHITETFRCRTCKSRSVQVEIAKLSPIVKKVAALGCGVLDLSALADFLARRT